MGEHGTLRTPHATWLPSFVALLTQRFGDRLGQIRPTTVLIAVERTAIELDLDSVVRLLPMIRYGEPDSLPVRLLLAYLEGTHPSGAYTIPPRRNAVSDAPPVCSDVHRTAPRSRARGDVPPSQADTLPPPPMPVAIDTSARALVDRACRLFAEGHSDASLRLLAVAIEVDPGFDDAYRVASMVAESLGRFEVADILRRRPSSQN